MRSQQLRLALAALLGQLAAGRFISPLPAQTGGPAVDIAAIGWMPKPTQAPEIVYGAALDVLRRQEPLGANTCGYVAAQSDQPYICPIGECGYNSQSHLFGCCTETLSAGSVAGCTYFTSCVDFASSTSSSSSASTSDTSTVDAGVATCTASAAPYCAVLTSSVSGVTRAVTNYWCTNTSGLSLSLFSTSSGESSSSSSPSSSPTSSVASSSSSSSTATSSPSPVPAQPSLIPAKSSSGLSTGAKAGIGVGVGLGGLIVIAAGAWFFLRRKKGDSTTPPPAPAAAAAAPVDNGKGGPDMAQQQGYGGSYQSSPYSQNASTQPHTGPQSYQSSPYSQAAAVQPAEGQHPYAQQPQYLQPQAYTHAAELDGQPARPESERLHEMPSPEPKGPSELA